MKKHFKSYIIMAAILCAALLFIFYPFMCTDLHIKLYFGEDSDVAYCNLYYTTEDMPNFDDSNMLTAKATADYADILIPKEACGKLTNLRLDFSPVEDLISISRVELCSGGFIQKSFSGPDFFKEDNILQTNDLETLHSTKYITYIGTAGTDPYIMFQTAVVSACNNAFSHYTVTKLLICLFIAGTVILSRRKLFPAE